MNRISIKTTPKKEKKKTSNTKTKTKKKKKNPSCIGLLKNETTIVIRGCKFLPSQKLFALNTVRDKNIQLSRCAREVFGNMFVADWKRNILFSGKEMGLDRKDSVV